MCCICPASQGPIYRGPGLSALSTGVGSGVMARMFCLCILFLFFCGAHGDGPTDFVNVFVGTGKPPTS